MRCKQLVITSIRKRLEEIWNFSNQLKAVAMQIPAYLLDELGKLAFPATETQLRVKNMAFDQKTDFANRRQSMATYLCNVSTATREKLIGAMKTQEAREELRELYLLAKAKQILGWPCQVRNLYLIQLATTNPYQRATLVAFMIAIVRNENENTINA